MKHPAAALPVARAFQPEIRPEQPHVSGVFSTTESTEFTELAVDMHSSGVRLCRRAVAWCGVVFLGWCSPSPPTPLPRWGRGEDFVFLAAV